MSGDIRDLASVLSGRSRGPCPLCGLRGQHGYAQADEVDEARITVIVERPGKRTVYVALPTRGMEADTFGERVWSAVLWAAKLCFGQLSALDRDFNGVSEMIGGKEKM